MVRIQQVLSTFLYNKKQIFSVVAAVTLLGGIGLTMLAVQESRDSRSRAAAVTTPGSYGYGGYNNDVYGNSTPIATVIPTSTVTPTSDPTNPPTPTAIPTVVPTNTPAPTKIPTLTPTKVPTPTPTKAATATPTPTPKPAPVTITIDNPSATVVGSWYTGSSATGRYGSNYRYKGKGTGSAYLQYTPNLPTTGSYKVYEWHSAGTNRTTTAKAIIKHNTGSTTVTFNQQINGGKWNYLGTFTFAKGTTGYVRINDAFTTGSIVMADAIQFVSAW